MMGNRVQSRLGGLVLAVLIISLLLAACSSPAGKPAPTPAPVPAPSAGNSSGGAPQEGIKVHGRWTIEVINPDGTLAERREFDNALTTEAALALAEILQATNYRHTGWEVNVWSGATSTPFLEDSGTPARARIVGATFPASGRNIFKNLTINIPSTGDNRNKLVLSGTATAHRDGLINVVSTIMFKAPRSGTEIPYTGLQVDFTISSLSSAVTLTNGQQVLVTVVISFS